MSFDRTNTRRPAHGLPAWLRRLSPGPSRREPPLDPPRRKLPPIDDVVAEARAQAQVQAKLPD